MFRGMRICGTGQAGSLGVNGSSDLRAATGLRYGCLAVLAVSSFVCAGIALGHGRIEWSNPADITYGTPLSAEQLDATLVGATGTLTYHWVADPVPIEVRNFIADAPDGIHGIGNLGEGRVAPGGRGWHPGEGGTYDISYLDDSGSRRTLSGTYDWLYLPAGTHRLMARSDTGLTAIAWITVNKKNLSLVVRSRTRPYGEDNSPGWDHARNTGGLFDVYAPGEIPPYDPNPDLPDYRLKGVVEQSAWTVVGGVEGVDVEIDRSGNENHRSRGSDFTGLVVRTTRITGYRGFSGSDRVCPELGLFAYDRITTTSFDAQLHTGGDPDGTGSIPSTRSESRGRLEYADADAWFMTGDGFQFNGFVRGETYAGLASGDASMIHEGEDPVDESLFAVEYRKFEDNDPAGAVTDEVVDRVSAVGTKGRIRVIAAPAFDNYVVDSVTAGVLTVGRARIEINGRDLVKVYGDAVSPYLDDDGDAGTLNLDPALVSGPGDHVDDPFGLYNNFRLNEGRIQDIVRVVDNTYLSADGPAGSGTLFFHTVDPDVSLRGIINASYEIVHTGGSVTVEPRRYYLTVGDGSLVPDPLDPDVVFSRIYGDETPAIPVHVVNPAPHQVNLEAGEEYSSTRAYSLEELDSGFFQVDPVAVFGTTTDSGVGDHDLTFTSHGRAANHFHGGLLNRDGVPASVLRMRIRKRDLVVTVPDVAIFGNDDVVMPELGFRNHVPADFDAVAGRMKEGIIDADPVWVFSPPYHSSGMMMVDGDNNRVTGFAGTRNLVRKDITYYTVHQDVPYREFLALYNSGDSTAASGRYAAIPTSHGRMENGVPVDDASRDVPGPVTFLIHPEHGGDEDLHYGDDGALRFNYHDLTGSGSEDLDHEGHHSFGWSLENLGRELEQGGTGETRSHFFAIGNESELTSSSYNLVFESSVGSSTLTAVDGFVFKDRAAGVYSIREKPPVRIDIVVGIDPVVFGERIEPVVVLHDPRTGRPIAGDRFDGPQYHYIDVYVHDLDTGDHQYLYRDGPDTSFTNLVTELTSGQRDHVQGGGRLGWRVPNGRDEAPYYRLNVDGNYELEFRLFTMGAASAGAGLGEYSDYWGNAPGLDMPVRDSVWDTLNSREEEERVVTSTARLPLTVLPRQVVVQPETMRVPEGSRLPENPDYRWSYSYEALPSHYLHGYHLSGGLDSPDAIVSGNVVYPDPGGLFESTEIEAESRIFTTDATDDSPAGTYVINVSGFTANNGNAEFTYRSGRLRITERRFEVIWPGEPAPIEYGEALTAEHLDAVVVPHHPGSGELVYTVDGRNVEVGDLIDAGENPITARYFSRGNSEYGDSEPVTRILTVGAKPAILTLRHFSKVFGDEDPAWNAETLVRESLPEVLVDRDRERIGLTFISPLKDHDLDDEDLEPVGIYPVGLQIDDPYNRIVNYDLQVTEGSVEVTRRDLTVRPADRSDGWRTARLGIHAFPGAPARVEMPAAWIVFGNLAPKHAVDGDARLIGTGKGPADNPTRYLGPSWTALDRLFGIALRTDVREDDPIGTTGEIRVLSVSARGEAAGNYTIDHSGTGTLTLTREPVGLEWIDPDDGKVILYGQKLRDVMVGEHEDRDRRGNVSSLLTDANAEGDDHQDYTFDADIFDAIGDPGGGTYTYIKVSGGGPPLDVVNGTGYLPTDGDIRIRLTYRPSPEHRALYASGSIERVVRITERPLRIVLQDRTFTYGEVDAGLDIFDSSVVRYGKPGGTDEKKWNHFRLIGDDNMHSVMGDRMVLATNVRSDSPAGSNYYIAVEQSPTDASGNYMLDTAVEGSAELKVHEGVYNLEHGATASIGDTGQTRAARITIDRAPLTIRATDLVKARNEPNLNARRIPSEGFVATGYLPMPGEPYTVEVGDGQLRNGDTLEEVFRAGIRITSPVGPSTDYGRYVIRLGVGFPDNYAVTGRNGVFAVQPPVLWSPADLIYGMPLSGAQLDARSGDADITGSFDYSENPAGTILMAGDHLLRATFETRYGDFMVARSMTVDKAPLVVTADDATRDYYRANPADWGYTIAGFANGEDESDLGGDLVFDTAGVAGASAGTYPVVPSGLTSDNYDIRYVDGVLTVERFEVELVLSDLEQVYDGTAKRVTVDPPDLPLVVTYDGRTDAPVDAGSYRVVATVDSPGYSGTASGTLVVEKAMAAVTIDPVSLDQAVNRIDRRMPLRIATDPEGLRVDVTYDGMADVPGDTSTSVGEVAVVATVDHPNYAGTVSETLVIRKAVQAIEVINESSYQPWPVEMQGAPITIPLFATAESGEPVTFSVRPDPGNPDGGLGGIAGNLLTVTRPGEIRVLVEQAGDAYWAASSRAFTVTLTGVGQTVDITVSDLEHAYDGTAKRVSVVTVPEDLDLAITYDGGAEVPSDIGTYQVVVASTDPLLPASETVVMTIGKGMQTISLTNPGQYSPWPIPMEGAVLGIPLFAASSSGLPVRFVNITVDEGEGASAALGIVVKGSGVLSALHPGTFTIRAVQDGDDSYNPAESTFEVTVTGQGVGTAIVLDDLEQVYDGAPKGVAWITVPRDLDVSVTYDGRGEMPTDAGTYRVMATSNDPRFPSESSGTLTITRAEAAVIIDAAGLAQPVDGLVPPPVSTIPPGLTVDITYDGSAELPADEAASVGEVEVVATIDEANHQGSTTATLTVGKAPQMLRVVDPARYDPWMGAMQGRPLDIPLRTTSGSGFPASYAIESVTASDPRGRGPEGVIDGTILTVSQPGTFTIEATHPGDDYWAEAEVAFDVVVGGQGVKTPATLTLGNLDHVHDGSARSAAVTVDPAGLTVEVTYDGMADAPIDAGSYQVVATVIDDAYHGTASGTLTIGKAPAEVTIDPSGLVQIREEVVAVAVTTDPGGLAVDVTYDGVPELPVNAGFYLVVATVNEANYQGGVTATLMVEKKAQTITFGDESVYNPWPVRFAGGPVTIPLVATSDSDLAIGFTVDAVDASIDGGVLTVNRPGAYAVRADQPGDDRWLAAPTAELMVVVEGGGDRTVRPRLSVAGLENGALTLDVAGAPDAKVDIRSTDDLVAGEFALVRTIRLDADGNGTVVLPASNPTGFYMAEEHVPSAPLPFGLSGDE